MKNKEPQITKFIRFERFENYNVKEMFGNLMKKDLNLLVKVKTQLRNMPKIQLNYQIIHLLLIILLYQIMKQEIHL